MDAALAPPEWLRDYYEGYEPSRLFDTTPTPMLGYGPSIGQLRAWRDADPAWFDEALRTIYAEEVS